ncbi:MAG: DUF5668 domain-containing protein [Candidatus Edwardsbacteria bacterium]|nr:DUF5668 domain-containing protein [Candidatus Edwardsbacteria bacterium]
MFCCNRILHKVLWGLFWITLGAWLLLSNYDLVAYRFSFHRDWPVILIAIGVIILFRSFFRRKHGWHVWRECSRSDKEADKQSREQILKSVEDGKMNADEAARRLKNL